MKLNISFTDNVRDDIKSKYTVSENYKTDSGLDIYLPNDTIIPSGARSYKVQLGIKCAVENNFPLEKFIVFIQKFVLSFFMIYSLTEIIINNADIRTDTLIFSMLMYFIFEFNQGLILYNKLKNNKNVHGYMLLPRSSTGSKTTIRLCNSVGVIDYEYRGEIMAVVDNLGDLDIVLNRGERYFQLVAPDFRNIKYRIIDQLSTTTRGEGGFGSTTNTQQVIPNQAIFGQIIPNKITPPNAVFHVHEDTFTEYKKQCEERNYENKYNCDDLQIPEVFELNSNNPELANQLVENKKEV
jgi:hypothetical protein